MYANIGIIEGSLAKDPRQVAEGVVIVTLRVKDFRKNPNTGRREFHYPTFTAFGKKAANILKYLEKNQQVYIEYKLETRRKEQEGGAIRKYEDKIVLDVKFGKKSENRTSTENSYQVKVEDQNNEDQKNEIENNYENRVEDQSFQPVDQNFYN